MIRAFAPILVAIALTSSTPAAGGDTSAAGGQTPLALTPGSPAGSFALSGFESVNLFNGNLNFHLPLLTIGGRGEASTALALAIERRWLLRREPYDYTDPPVRYSPDVGWWGPKPGYGPGVMMMRQAVQDVIFEEPHGVVARRALTRLTFTGPDGTEQEFRDVATGGRPFGWPERFQNRGQVFVAADGSAATFVSDTTVWDAGGLNGDTRPAPGGRLLFRDGTEYRIGDPAQPNRYAGLVTRIRDRNGNVLVFEYQGNSVSSITDSLGRRVTISYLGYQGPNGWVPTDDLITYYGFQGNGSDISQRQIVVRRDTLANRLSPGEQLQTLAQLFPPLDFGNAPFPYSTDVIASVVLPNGTAYDFWYNRYAELTRVQLPTGGVIEYTWASGTEDPAGLYGVTDPDGGERFAVYRRVSSRKVYNYEQLEQWTEYAPGACASPLGLCVEVRHRDPALGATLGSEQHYFFGDPLSSFWSRPCDYPAWREGREEGVQLHGAGGELLRTVANTWEQRAAVPWWQDSPDTAPPNDVRLTRVVATLNDSGEQSKVVYGYDAFNNVTMEQGFDYGASQPSRVTETAYVADLAYVSEFSAAHIRDLPSDEKVYDATGLRSHTKYDYDTAALTPRDGIVGWVAVGSNRGNLTRTSRYLGSPSQWIVSERRYDVAGNVVKVSDPLGHATFIEYSDNFGQPDGRVHEGVSFGRNTFAFPTIVTNAAGHIVQTQYDFYTGHPVDQADANGVVTKLNRNDILDRLTEVTRAANPGLEAYASQTRFEYRDGRSVRELRTFQDKDSFGDGNVRAVSIFDELGRGFISKTKEGPASWIEVEKRFDARGRVSQLSNPYREPSEEPAWTTTRYDALDRPVSVKTPDGATVVTNYLGSTTVVIDPAGKTRSIRTDALGRVLSVVEDPSGLAQETTYAYDAFDRMTDVRQGSQARSFVYDTLGRLRSASNPESGTVTYEYDLAGNLVDKTDARGIKTTTRYDSLHRVTRREYGDATAAVTFTYDTDALSGSYPVGQMTQVANAASETDYHHDPLGRVVGSGQTTGGRVYSMAYAYDRADNLVSETYPSGRAVTTDYDDLSRVANVSEGAQVYGSEFGYSAHGAVTKLRLGNGLWERMDFNNRLQPTLIGLGRSKGAADVLAISYLYGAPWNNGNVTRQTITAPGMPSLVQNYNYDELNRLASAQEVGSWTQIYTYDRWGNRAATGFLPVPGATAQNINTNFDPSRNRLRLGAVAYDAAGNQTLDPLGRVATYDAENRLVSFGGGLATYAYDGEGRRVRKTEGDAVTTFVYDALGRLVAEYGASASSTAGTSYLTTDSLGNTRLVSDALGQVVSRHDFLPFGEEIPATFGGRAGAFGYGTSDGIRQRFTGKERDSESGLDYFGARYLSGAQGRFTSPDPAFDFSASIADPQRWNRYAYVSNNPLRKIDPDGEKEIDLAKGFVRGLGQAAVGLLVSTMAIAESRGLPSYDSIMAIDAAVEDAKFMGYGVTHPGEVVDQYVQMSTSNDDADQQALGEAVGQGTFVAGATLAPFARGAPRITEAYRRPSGATTAEQRALVQEQPCVKCGASEPRMVAGHKKPLVKEYYETGRIDVRRMRAPKSVQPECPTCSAREGAEMSRYSAAKKKELEF